MQYFGQETEYTCAVACLRMVISHFDKVVPSEQKLALELKTSNTFGTHPKEIERWCEENDYLSSYFNNGSLEEVEFLTRQGWVCMLLISVDVPHFVIYSKSNGSHVFFNDPFFGEGLSRDKRKFDSCRQSFPIMRWRIKVSEFAKYFPMLDTEKMREIECSKAYIAIKKKRDDSDKVNF